ncbi:MAG: YolD-like family protein [Vulcanibacillus sp.]
MKRGNLLWIGSRMMLAEHRQLINEQLNYQKGERDLKHEYDEQKFEELQEKWLKAVTNNSSVVIKLNNKLLIELSGKIVDCDSGQDYFYLQKKEGERVKIIISEIVDIIIDTI